MSSHHVVWDRRPQAMYNMQVKGIYELFVVDVVTSFIKEFKVMVVGVDRE